MASLVESGERLRLGASVGDSLVHKSSDLLDYAVSIDSHDTLLEMDALICVGPAVKGSFFDEIDEEARVTDRWS
jgi:hypothetical protein